MGAGGELKHWREQRDGNGVSVARAYVRVDADASYQCFQWCHDGARVRDELEVKLAMRGASTLLAGVATARAREHGDFALRIEHAASNTTSRSEYRAIASERGKLVFTGQIHIPREVGGIDAALTTRNLLLSNDAEIDTRPELQIYADDVRCSHGATVGQLDADALFLLRSRGIDEVDARALVTRAFALSALAGLPDDPTKAQWHARIAQHLGAPS